MSLLSHQPPRFSTTSTSTISATTSTTNTSTATLAHHVSRTTTTSSVHRPPLLSIHQIQPSNNSTGIYSPKSSSSSSTSICSTTPLSKPLPSAREKRRKLRSTRAGSPTSPQPASPPHSTTLLGARSHKLKPTAAVHLDSRRPSELDSNSDHEESCEPVRQRLKLSRSGPPRMPPTIPKDWVIPRSEWRTYAHTPLIEPSQAKTHKDARDIHTCIRTRTHPYSVSISSQPPPHFSKSMARLTRASKSNLPHLACCKLTTLEIKRAEELDKWWYWAKNCRITGDGNKSSHLTPLRCLDLKPDSSHLVPPDPQPDRLLTLQHLNIITKPFSESALEQQNFHYSGPHIPPSGDPQLLVTHS